MIFTVFISPTFGPRRKKDLPVAEEIDSPLPAVGPSDICDHNKNGVPELMVKFDRSQVQELVEPEEAILTITGTTFGGAQFLGSDTIRIR